MIRNIYEKIFFIGLFTLFVASFTFAAEKDSSENGGKDKIGGYIGSPFGLSYSHKFNDLIELDLVVGYSGIWRYNSFDMQVGALFTVFDPILSGLGNQHCPLSLGPVLGGSINVMKYPPYKAVNTKILLSFL